MADIIEINNNWYTQFARARAFIPNGLLGLLMILKFLFEEALVWLTRPTEVFLHVRFGVRGHSLFQVLQICFTGVFIGYVLAAFDPMFLVFTIISAGLAVYHRVDAVRWELHGSPDRYSWSNGEPIFVWEWLGRKLEAAGISPWRFLTVPLICRFYEPLLVLGFGSVPDK